VQGRSLWEKYHGMNWKRTLFYAWLSQLLTQFGFSAVMPFIPLYIGQLLNTDNERQIGLWVALFYFFSLLSFCLVMPVWGRLSDQYGRRKMLIISNFCNALLIPLMCLASNVMMLVLVRSIASACGGMIILAQSLVSAQTPNERQGFALGILSTAEWGGLVLGFLLGGVVLDRFGFVTGFLICGLMSALAGLMVYYVRDEDSARSATAKVPLSFRYIMATHFSLPSMEKIVVSTMLLFIGVQFLRNFDGPYVPMMVKTAFGTANVAGKTGVISAIACVGGMFSGLLAGWLCDRVPARLIIIPSLVVTALATAVQPLALTVAWFSAFRFLQGLSAGCLVSVLLTLISRNSRPEERSTIFALASSSSTAAMALGTLCGGAIVATLGVPWTFYIPLLLYVLLIPLFRSLLFDNRGRKGGGKTLHRLNRNRGYRGGFL
jgi:DHA1 family multidrug resistance protein-like MFS transporter